MYLTKLCSENLFLLEFLVQGFKIRAVSLPAELSSVEGETCVSATFLENGSLEICAEDGRSATKSGKSCLFALDPVAAAAAIHKFNVDLRVYKRFGESFLPSSLQIGEACISITDKFTQVVEKIVRDGNKEPASESHFYNADIKGTIPGGDSFIGKLKIFIRISCFGKMIVSEISSPVPTYPSASQRSVRYKRYGDAARYRPTFSSESNFLRCKGGADYYLDEEASESECLSCDVGCPGPDTCLSGDMDQRKRKSVTFPSNLPCCAASSPSLPGGPSPQPCPPPPCPLQSSAMPCFPYGPNYPCGCPTNFPSPATGFPVIPPPARDCTCSAPRTAKYPSCGCTHGATRLADPCDCLARGPRTRAPICVEKQVLSMLPGDDPANPFSFKVSGCGAKANQNISVVPPVSLRPDGMRVTEISDPHKDVFTLRIGQKDETEYRQPRLELELVTRKPSAPTTTVDTQCDPPPGDQPKAPAAKGKKAKGKAKGKKKK